MRPLALLAVVAACGGGGERSINVPAVVRDRVTSRDAIAVIDLDEARFVFDPRVVHVWHGDRVVAEVSAPGGTWTDAQAIAAPDGGTWVSGLSGGTVWRVSPAGELEAVSERFGIDGIVSIASTGTSVALASDQALVVMRDRTHMSRFPGLAGRVAVGGARLAVAERDRVDVLDLARGVRTSYPRAASAIGFVDADTAPHLAMVSAGALYVEQRGELRRVQTPADVQAMTVSDDRVWLVVDGALAAFDHGRLILTSVRTNRILAATHGRVWAAGADLALVDLDLPTVDATWTATVQPIFERACARCHSPGGRADVDLSTPQAWSVERAEILRRVVEDRSMPPPGEPLADADRAVLARWLRR